MLSYKNMREFKRQEKRPNCETFHSNKDAAARPIDLQHLYTGPKAVTLSKGRKSNFEYFPETQMRLSTRSDPSWE